MSANESRRAAAEVDPLREVPLTELLAALAGSVKSLAAREVELAQAEARSDLRASLQTMKRFGAAAVCGLLGVNLLLVAGVLALARVLPAWAAALAVATPLVAAGLALGAIGWSRRPRAALSATRSTLKEDFEWAKDRLS